MKRRITPALGDKSVAFAGQKFSELVSANLLADIVQEQNPERADERHFHHRVPIIPIWAEPRFRFPLLTSPPWLVR